MGKIKKLLADVELSRAKKRVLKAKKKPIHDADRAFNDAYQKFSAAANFDPANAAVMHQWGLALLDHARIKGGSEANKFFKSACERFQAALKLNPESAIILNDWGATLMEQARQKSPKAASPLYRKAKEKFNEVERLEPGLSAYNLACLHSLQGEQQECKKRLEQARDSGRLPSNKFLNSDEDLKPCRDEPWFKTFIESLTPKEDAPPST
ncbi:MAG: hypothetical protein ABFS02_04435 [Pseudomonadota bacterium]